MYKKCKNETVTINYVGRGNMEYSCINAVYYNPDADKLMIAWADCDCSVIKYASDVYGFITFEDGIEWEIKRA